MPFQQKRPNRLPPSPILWDYDRFDRDEDLENSQKGWECGRLAGFANPYYAGDGLFFECDHRGYAGLRAEEAGVVI